jgi:hypothetical protein
LFEAADDTPAPRGRQEAAVVLRVASCRNWLETPSRWFANSSKIVSAAVRVSTT